MNHVDGNAGGESRECRRVRRLLSDRLDGPLDEEESRRIAAHLPGCPGCTAFERRLGAGMRSVAALPGAPGSPRVREAVLRETAGRRPRAWLGQGLKLAGAIAAFAIVGFVLVAVMRPGRGDTGTDDSHAGAGADDTPTAQATSTLTPAAEPAVAPGQPCVTDLLTAVAQAVTLSSTPNGADVWFRVTFDSAPCEIPAIATVTLSGLDGTPLAIEGNGLAAALVASGEDIYTGSVLWLNWCGDPGPFYLVLGFGPETHTTQIKATPGCDDAVRPSRLGQASSIEPTPVWPDTNAPTCRGDQLEMSIDVTSEDATGAMRYVAFKVAPADAPCTIDNEFTIQIEDSNGDPLAIAGNGMTVRLTNDMPYANLSWTNWCGDLGPFQVAIEGESSSSRAGPIDPPSCLAAGEQSTLQPLDGLAPTPPSTDVLPACPEDQVTYSVETEGAAGTRYIWILVEGPGKVECVVDEHPTITIVDANGAALDILGNGLVAAINGPEPAVLEAWVGWTNWCDASGSFQAIISGEAGSTTIEVDSPPCIDAGQASQLQVVASPYPGPAPTPGGPADQLRPTPTPSPAAELPACTNGDYQLTLGSGSGLTGGKIGFGVTATVAATPCRIDGGITFTLRDATGAPLDVDGNGVTVALDAWPEGYALQRGFTWSNWCGSDLAVTAEVTTADGTTATVTVDRLAGCMSGPDSAPSTLHVAPGN